MKLLGTETVNVASAWSHSAGDSLQGCTRVQTTVAMVTVTWTDEDSCVRHRVV